MERKKEMMEMEIEDGDDRATDSRDAGDRARDALSPERWICK